MQTYYSKFINALFILRILSIISSPIANSKSFLLVTQASWNFLVLCSKQSILSSFIFLINYPLSSMSIFHFFLVRVNRSISPFFFGDRRSFLSFFSWVACVPFVARSVWIAMALSSSHSVVVCRIFSCYVEHELRCRCRCRCRCVAFLIIVVESKGGCNRIPNFRISQDG